MRLLPFVVLLLALTAGPASPAQAVERSFFGVNASTTGDAVAEGDVALLGGARVGRIRMGFEWGTVQPQRGGPFDWSFLDRSVGRAAQARVTVLATLQGSPAWVAAKGSFPPRTADSRRAFATFVRAAVKRYGRNGAFWKANPRLPYRPVVSWQVWNEQNLGFWWYDNPNPREYAQLLRTTSSTIRRADRRAEIVLGGMPETHGVPMATYLDRLYRVSSKVKGYFDVIAVHPFGRGWPGVEGALFRARQVTRRHRDDRTPILITEIGWATGGGRDIDFQVTTPKGQADRLRSTFRNLARTRRKWNVDGVLWYTWKDLPPYDWWILNCGLFDRDGNPKPSWAVFRSFTRATS